MINVQDDRQFIAGDAVIIDSEFYRGDWLNRQTGIISSEPGYADQYCIVELDYQPYGVCSVDVHSSRLRLRTSQRLAELVADSKEDNRHAR